MKSFAFVVLCALVAVCAGAAVREKRGGLYSGIGGYGGWAGGYGSGWGGYASGLGGYGSGLGGYSSGLGGYGRGWGGYAPIVKTVVPISYGGVGYGGGYSSGWW